MRDHTAIRGHYSPECGQNLDRDFLAILGRAMLRSAEQGTFFRLMPQNKFAHLVDGLNAVQITIALRHSPGEQSVAAENEAFRKRIILDSPFNHERQFESGALPGDPYDLAIKFLVELVQFSLPIGARGQSDGPVRVQMIHVSEG